MTATHVPRQEVTVSFYDRKLGKRNMTIIDLPTIDDVFEHMVNKEIYKIITGLDQGNEISREFKDFLIRERYFVR